MRHNCRSRRFSRDEEHRRSMFRNLATSLLREEKIVTTVEKAKDLRGVVEKIITMAGVDNLANRKRAHGYLMSDEVIKKLFVEIGPKYKTRPGGYTRVVRTGKTGRRLGDGAKMAVIELV